MDEKKRVRGSDSTAVFVDAVIMMEMLMPEDGDRCSFPMRAPGMQKMYKSL